MNYNNANMMYQQPMLNNPYYPQYQQNYAQREQQYNNVQRNFPTLYGKIYDNENEITANDVPMDGSCAIFLKRDGSEMLMRSWNANGTISNLTYKPILPTDSNNVSTEQEKPKFDLSDESTKAFMQKFDELNEKIDKFLKPKGRKEVADE